VNEILTTAKLLLLFAFGACAGSLVNLGVYRLAWRRRAISPWSRPPDGAPPRRPADRLPIFGWLGLRREAALHGRGFWVRPMLVELGMGVGFAALYAWEVGAAGLLPPGFPRALFPTLPAVLHCQYFAHLALIALMLVASLIDCDEKNIPDAITVPGTLVGLLLAALCPWSLLPVPCRLFNGAPFVDFLRLTTPATAPGGCPPLLAGFPNWVSLAIALGCFWAWCAALSPRSWHSRHGRRRAMQLCLARLVRSRASYVLLGLALVGAAGIAAAWVLGGLHWDALLTALVGMAASGGLVWLVRILGTAALGKEAMGFGDVTLMAMLGAFLGWQACLIVFFLAPLLGLVLGLVQLLLRRGSEIPYGPFLCLAALATIIYWAAIWNWALPLFILGSLLPLLLLGCLVLMVLMLLGLRLLKSLVIRRR
jgi:prepilin signal peptidase PulO-like enzyme (type II secretory pathway)